jgi:antirestriction protein ArdC
MFLSMMMAMNKWEHPFFMTFNGVKQKGGIVKKGEKSLPIFWFEMIPLKDKTTGEVTGAFPKLKVFNVFHVSQTTVDPSECSIAQCEGRKIDEIEALIASLGVKIEAGEPSYVPSLDVVRMPEIKAFKSEADFYSTIFHELSHFTMHQDRCNRVGDKKLPYAQEELVAELGSAFLCAEFGIEGELQHTEYIGHWIQLIRNQPRTFFDSARLAQKAANFILQKKYEKKEEEAA